MTNPSTPKDIEYATGGTWPAGDQAAVLRSMVAKQKLAAEARLAAANERGVEIPTDALTDIPTVSEFELHGEETTESGDAMDIVQPVCPTTIAVSGGKGGVGKSNLCLNIAICLAEQGNNVVLIDANRCHGNVDLLCGLNGYWSLEHVVSGVRPIEDVLLDGPHGLRILPASDQFVDLNQSHASQNTIQQLFELEDECDYVLIDAGIASDEALRQMIGLTDATLLVTSPEPTSIADTYATIKQLSHVQSDIRVAVNLTRSAEQGQAVFDRIDQTTKSFLEVGVRFAGAIPFDHSVFDAVSEREPVCIRSPDSLAAKCISHLTELLQETRPKNTSTFLDRFLKPDTHQSAA
ncbi:P-loop NTPase [bacterium]|nr:P-loop NTPase [bacterium]